MSFAQTVIVGNIGRTEDVRYSTNGDAVCNFSVAVNEAYTNRNGKRQENTEWYRCVAYRRTAEIVGEYGAKGKQVLVRGKMKTRSFEKDGQARQVTELVVAEFQLLGSRDAGGGQGKDAGRSRQAAQRQQVAGKPTANIMDVDDVPF